MVRSEKLPYPGLRVASAPARTSLAASGNFTLGALPLHLFVHGHGYFVQRAKVSVAGTQAAGASSAVLPSPYAVHATYTLDHHDHIAKRQRFHEAGLWRADGGGGGESGGERVDRH